MVARHELWKAAEESQQADLHIKDGVLFFPEELLADPRLHLRNEAILGLHQSTVDLSRHKCEEIAIQLC